MVQNPEFFDLTHIKVAETTREEYMQHLEPHPHEQSQIDKIKAAKEKKAQKQAKQVLASPKGSPQKSSPEGGKDSRGKSPLESAPVYGDLRAASPLMIGGIGSAPPDYNLPQGTHTNSQGKKKKHQNKIKMLFSKIDWWRRPRPKNQRILP